MLGKNYVYYKDCCGSLVTKQEMTKSDWKPSLEYRTRPCKPSLLNRMLRACITQEVSMPTPMLTTACASIASEPLLTRWNSTMKESPKPRFHSSALAMDLIPLKEETECLWESTLLTAIF